MNYSRYGSRVSQGVNVNDKGYDTGFKVVQCDYVFSMQNIFLYCPVGRRSYSLVLQVDTPALSLCIFILQEKNILRCKGVKISGRLKKTNQRSISHNNGDLLSLMASITHNYLNNCYFSLLFLL